MLKKNLTYFFYKWIINFYLYFYKSEIVHKSLYTLYYSSYYILSISLILLSIIYNYLIKRHEIYFQIIFITSIISIYSFEIYQNIKPEKIL